MSNTDLLSGDVAATAASAAEPGEQNGTAAPKRRSGGLSGMVIADLRELAGQLGIGDTKGMRKGDLIAAIRERQGKAPRKRAGAADETLPLDGIAAKVEAPVQTKPVEKTRQPAEAPADKPAPAEKAERSGKPEKAEKPVNGAEAPQQQGEDGPRREGGARRRRGANRAAGSPDNRGGDNRGDQGQRGGNERGGDQSQQGGGDQRKRNDQRDNAGGGQPKQNSGGQNSGGGQDDDEGGRRGRRFRDRRRRGNRGEGGADTEIREDDVLLPVAGILDVLDNYAFVRTSGYLPGPNDVYVSLSLVRKHGLRRGDAITGVVKQPREGEQQRQKFNPLVRVDTVNGLDSDEAKRRPEFTKLTPLYPNERLRLETESHKLTTRVIDLVMPVGKGQRALIVSPPKAGKTTIMQDIANAITTNNPECHLMVVLVDERPEEVTDMQRSVKGEVIASTFDRPPSDHTSVAELSIERAKRLVEMGMDVVVLLDSITRLGRAYNLAAPASGRILSGGVDSTALFPPKRFLGAARNIENGGSLTIFATAMVETGSTGDTVIFEEFKGTGNAELKLDRKIAERRVFPAVDVNPSGTRKEELLLSPDELAVTHKLHRVLHALDSQQAIDLLLSRLRKTKTNIEFLMQVSKTALASDDD
ncbi:transcription termination factor Rho [Amycolatopsis endophytica]|uniref:Transcription termination factor Rho n=1 Tax=Amycolatopsis endophytica TaxID=860233 RepID=A0A853AX54_9PSEU|nr:transcription termination factor Rho [Amycolatopsis endophytica]NYI87171.1 transcription termination factor Rho [Amycolatopsis endophytica]